MKGKNAFGKSTQRCSGAWQTLIHQIFVEVDEGMNVRVDGPVGTQLQEAVPSIVGNLLPPGLWLPSVKEGKEGNGCV